MKSIASVIVSLIASTQAIVQTEEEMKAAVMADVHKKLNDDIAKFVEQYDFESAWDKAQTDLKNKRETITLAEASLEDLIAATQDKFATEKMGFWNTAPASDTPLFEHINLEFNIHDGIVTAETAAKNHRGESLYTYEFTPNSVQTIEPVSAAAPVSELISNALANLPQTQEISQTVQPEITAVPQPIQIQTTYTPEVVQPIAMAVTSQTVMTTDQQKAAQRQLELDEAREVAFQVVFFFIFLIIASFGLLYIYHKMSQEREMMLNKQKTKRETFFEFLAGNMDENYPVVARPNMTTKYGI